ncbi:hypothetical protein PHLH6_57940 [Pseudomonas sp. Seg1]|uniref:dermonecrotic toxin domain-containing protein n=1 Tax=Pseudomonas sp. Seg1 TaxID=2678259 RepID=UPI001BB30EA2|nr:DUF6543 domain-containing protein [Pseudomonas sp. Seg1]BBP73790.1 hypothetical protein PHLH6_57940 [Pseudomonas sp. Seg1]
MPEISLPSAVDVLTQLVTGPSLREVATQALRPELKTLYPNLNIDPQLAMVVTPTWIVKDDRVVSGGDQVESLTDVLVRLGLSGTTVTYLDDEHFLTLHPGSESAFQLPVEVDALASLLNELAPLLFVAYREQQVDYWNRHTSPAHPRWYQLSDALRNLWNVDASLGWDADQQAMAHAVFRHPDKHQRLSGDKYKTRACLIDLDQGDGEKRTHVHVLDTAVLVGTHEKRTLIVTHSLVNGFRRFDSMEALGDALPRRYRENTAAGDLHWRLFEPDGNFFDHQACTLIALEADALGEINFFAGSTLNNLFPHNGTAGDHSEPAPRLKPHVDRLQPMLPSWLDNANAADQTSFSRHLLDLTVVQHQNAGKSFQSEVASLDTFTREALTRQIRKDHPKAGEVKIDEIEISITSLDVWGTFVVPFNSENQTFSLSELTLQNLEGMPLGNKTVRYRDGSALPDWLTVAYVEKLVTTVNIGKTYPAYLQKLLVDDSVQASALQKLYVRQLPIELPMLALQHKIRGEAGIDEQGYRYLLAALGDSAEDRVVDGQEIIISPLAFNAHHISSRADTVVNMFVIGPRQTDKGPYLLYRPLFEKPLIQYPSRTNLLYAIKHSRLLRESVLAWLPDDVRFNYSQYVFPAKMPSVWVIPQAVVNPVTAVDMLGVAQLHTRAITDDVLQTLHKANVEAILTQADRQTVSNAEARWASVKHGGWMLFNAALPFLGRGISTAAWIWQILDDLQEVSDGANQPTGKIAWTALADILLALGMVLAHRAAVGKAPRREIISAAETAERLLPTVVPEVVKPVRLPDVTTLELPVGHDTSLNASVALARSGPSLESLLDSLKTTKPKDLGTATTEGLHRHLFAHQKKWYAPVGKRWFEVQLNDNGDVQIIDSHQVPTRTGPLLTVTAGGRWVIDLRLRLRGGALRSRIAQARLEKQQKLAQLKSDISAFDLTMQPKQDTLADFHTALLEALPEKVEETRKQYLDTLESQLSEYTAHIDQLKALNLAEPVPNYRTAMIDRLTMQMFLCHSWFIERNLDYSTTLTATTDLFDHNATAQADHVAAFEKLNELTGKFIAKLEFAHTRFDELKLLGKEGVETQRRYQAKLPAYEINDLKMLEISLAQRLCLKAGPPESAADARIALEDVIEDAALNIQSSMDLSTDENLDNLAERIEATSNLAEQFTAIDQRFVDLLVEYPEHFQPERMAQVRKQINAFSEATVNRLGNLLRDQLLLGPKPGPSRPRTNFGKKIIKTRYKGTLVGEVRKSADGQDTDLVDVRAKVSGRLIATFHEKTPGEWVERVTPKTSPTPSRPNLKNSLAVGQTLIDDLPAFHKRTDGHIKRAKRIPAEAESLYQVHAVTLRSAREAIDQALIASNETADRVASTLVDALDSAAAALDKKGRKTRITLIKQQPPTAAHVQWLNNVGEVKISKTVSRRRLKGPKDFLDEYEISDARTGAALWYAHIHYDNATAPATASTARHMKTLEQRRLGGAYDMRNLSNQELIKIHRSAMTPKLAEELFFPPAKPAATASVLP